ncbi:MAG: hypothetical protein WEB52_02240 [Dehalococcoidia bacterium]
MNRATTIRYSRGLHERVEEYTGPFELPEPDDELDAMVERIVEREIRHVPTR